MSFADIWSFKGVWAFNKLGCETKCNVVFTACWCSSHQQRPEGCSLCDWRDGMYLCFICEASLHGSTFWWFFLWATDMCDDFLSRWMLVLLHPKRLLKRSEGDAPESLTMIATNWWNFWLRNSSIVWAAKIAEKCSLFSSIALTILKRYFILFPIQMNYSKNIARVNLKGMSQMSLPSSAKRLSDFP